MSSPEDALPWVGLYAGVASLVCTLAMAADVFRGFRQWKLWFPCKFFTLNAASITFIAIALKLPVDLTTKMPTNDDLNAKYVSMIFFFIILANSLPSLGLMDDKELLMNTIASATLIITFYVNVWIQFSTSVLPLTLLGKLLLIFPLLWFFSIVLIVSTCRRILELRYKELRILDSNHQGKKFSFKELRHYVKKYWMMAETGDPQFVLACSPVSSAFGVVCVFLAFLTYPILLNMVRGNITYGYGKSDYKWSIGVIIIIQSIGVVVGSIAPIFRCFTSISYFNLSKKWSMKHLNMFRVDKIWTQRLQKWKRSHVRSHIPGRYCKKVFHSVKNMILNFCIALQIMVIVICKMICLVPRFLLIVFSCFCYLCKSWLKMSKEELEASNSNVRSEMEEYNIYVVEIEDEARLSKTILRNMLGSITKDIRESEEKEPRNLIKLLEKSTGFKGVREFDNDQVLPSLHPEETHNCWSLVVVILTTIALSLPNIASSNIKGLLSGMKEGLRFVRHVEESFNENGDLVRARKAGRLVWTEVEVYNRWLNIDLQINAHKGKTSKEILQWLCDESIKIVNHYKTCKNISIEDSLHELIAASSMNRISQAILLHCNEQEEWLKDEELFEWMSTIIADLLCACFTNLPSVIKMKCHHDAIEKRGDNIQIAAQLLGKSKKILRILKARQLPNLDMDSMAYIDKWHALQESEIPKDSVSSNSDDSLIVIVE